MKAAWGLLLVALLQLVACGPPPPPSGPVASGPPPNLGAARQHAVLAAWGRWPVLVTFGERFSQGIATAEDLEVRIATLRAAASVPVLPGEIALPAVGEELAAQLRTVPTLASILARALDDRTWAGPGFALAQAASRHFARLPEAPAPHLVEGDRASCEEALVAVEDWLAWAVRRPEYRAGLYDLPGQGPMRGLERAFDGALEVLDRVEPLARTEVVVGRGADGHLVLRGRDVLGRTWARALVGPDLAPIRGEARFARPTLATARGVFLVLEGEVNAGISCDPEGAFCFYDLR